MPACAPAPAAAAPRRLALAAQSVVSSPGPGRIRSPPRYPAGPYPAGPMNSRLWSPGRATLSRTARLVVTWRLRLVSSRRHVASRAARAAAVASRTHVACGECVQSSGVAHRSRLPRAGREPDPDPARRRPAVLPPPPPCRSRLAGPGRPRIPSALLAASSATLSTQSRRGYPPRIPAAARQSAPDTPTAEHARAPGRAAVCQGRLAPRGRGLRGTRSFAGPCTSVAAGTAGPLGRPEVVRVRVAAGPDPPGHRRPPLALGRIGYRLLSEPPCPSRPAQSPKMLVESGVSVSRQRVDAAH